MEHKLSARVQVCELHVNFDAESSWRLMEPLTSDAESSQWLSELAFETRFIRASKRASACSPPATRDGSRASRWAGDAGWNSRDEHLDDLLERDEHLDDLLETSIDER